MSSADIVRRRIRRLWQWPLIALVVLSLAAIAAYELIASPFQATLLATYAQRLNFQLEDGPSDRIRFPKSGPYDIRLGYVGLPGFSERLTKAGFAVTRQARMSPEMKRIMSWGLFPPYREKSAAGLDVRDCRNNVLYQSHYPRHTYPEFKAVPAVVANTLLFIENRELLDPNHPQRNPAIEWDRLAQALLEKAMQTVDPARNVPGGSTLATQIEKYRHSPDGLTLTAGDKLTQMASASVRAYLEGRDTRITRQRIVLDYLNTVPLAAAPRHGEVHGIGDGLEAWFGLDFDQVNQLLRKPEPSAEAARAYKHVLGLLISQRKPSWYLLSGREQLDRQADAHLKLMTEAGVITPAFRDLALKQHIRFRDKADYAKSNGNSGFIGQKAANAMRVELTRLLNVPGLYDLDRIDLTAESTLHVPTQRAIADFLSRLDDPVVVEAAGLYGHYLLSPGNDLSKPIFGFTLYELSDRGALLRVQADNLNQPFDINQGAKLDMGSSAKLRTLITYLQIIAELHAQYAGLDGKALAAVPATERDVLTRWMLDWLRRTNDRSLEAALTAAMDRTYSASPGESFFTGGGLHRFNNFHKEDDAKVMDLWEATRHSVNLPFIRLMRDIVRHFMYRAPSTAARVMQDANDPRRQTYLLKFADQEGQAFLARFYKKYKGSTPQQATDSLLNHLTANPKRLAAVYRYLNPRSDLASFTALLKSRLTSPASLDEGDFAYLYETYGPDKFNLSDRGYITQIHPLELWLVAYLNTHPKAGWKEIVQSSANERVHVYEWLFSTSRKNAQDLRILSLLEIEAFQEIHRRWRKLGYPFSSLVPSYASAIGSSADRPAALAELLGVIRNDGVKLPPVSLTRLEFAAGTPFHTVFQRLKPRGEALFPAAVAQVLRRALIQVVEDGTARRVRGTFATADGGHLVIGGKTGTGDHRKEIYAANGTVLESKVMNRVATFAFFLGERYFGVMTAFVPGEAAGDYHFTSALPVQLLKVIEPALRPLVFGPEVREPTWAEQVSRFEAENPPRREPAQAAEPVREPDATVPEANAQSAPARAPAPDPAAGKPAPASGKPVPAAQKAKPAAVPVDKAPPPKTANGKAAPAGETAGRAERGETKPAAEHPPGPPPAPTAPSHPPAPQPPAAPPEKPAGNVWPQVPGEGFRF
ncbi:MAG TPA: transglycosylase domain-containing protein [Thiobacillaceae bacterium]|nr:transglycosylase domain-containing protein [Thiobacillaceae bacterium]